MSHGVEAAAADGGRQSNDCFRPSLGLFNRVDAFRSKAAVRHALSTCKVQLTSYFPVGGTREKLPPIHVTHAGKQSQFGNLTLFSGLLVQFISFTSPKEAVFR